VPSDSDFSASLLEDLLKDPMWRLARGQIYQVAPADGEGIRPFIPWPEQEKLLRAIEFGKHKKIAFLKARRPGGSTALGIKMLDMAIFKPGITASLIDQTAADAAKKMDRILGVALDNLPPWVKDDVKVIKRNDSQLSLSYRNGPVSNIYAGMDARGGSNDMLWASELGVIQWEDAKRAQKIRTGGLPSARHGIFVCETTWAGGKNGELWEMLQPTLDGEADDFLILFCPWWSDPRNVSEDAVLDKAALEYFAKLEPQMREKGVTFTEQQKRWWAQEKRALGIWMPRENPSVITECWESPVPGAIYAEALDAAQANGQFYSAPVDVSRPTWTSWDLGAPISTVTIYFQLSQDFIDIVDVDMDLNILMSDRVKRMQARNFWWGGHLLPHDEIQKQTSGFTKGAELAGLWLKCAPEMVGPNGFQRANFKHVMRTHDIELGINQLLQLMPRMRFRMPECKPLVERLALYRRTIAKPGKTDRAEPVHDFSSHAADAMRYIAEAHSQRIIEFKGVRFDASGWRYPSEFRQKRKGMRPQRVGG